MAFRNISSITRRCWQDLFQQYVLSVLTETFSTSYPYLVRGFALLHCTSDCSCHMTVQSFCACHACPSSPCALSPGPACTSTAPDKASVLCECALSRKTLLHVARAITWASQGLFHVGRSVPVKRSNAVCVA